MYYEDFELEKPMEEVEMQKLVDLFINLLVALGAFSFVLAIVYKYIGAPLGTIPRSWVILCFCFLGFAWTLLLIQIRNRLSKD
ncbi:hypothetical protein ACFL4G_13115 [Thermodesulfobacteriota bacterium]